MPSGGIRVGAGRPKKPLAEKLLNGNPGKRDIKVLKFGDEQVLTDNSKQQKPKSTKAEAANMLSYLDLVAKEGCDKLPPTSEIYKVFAAWINTSGCAALTAPHLIEDFAFLRRAYLECEYMNKHYGRLASGKRSPYVNMALDYHKAMMTVYSQVWIIISQNCETKYESKNEFIEMLKGRGF